MDADDSEHSRFTTLIQHTHHHGPALAASVAVCRWAKVSGLVPAKERRAYFDEFCKNIAAEQKKVRWGRVRSRPECPMTPCPRLRWSQGLLAAESESKA